ncbi:hypothetical protein U8607_18175 [Methylobacterium durans]|uniref:hypothetical protein n=1 Tax=Methylobacterium durans TaxID=2202825 RepID=UPI002AFDCD41|nr:hypothetical protein [Methylobacterium durans]MEA1834019.1 hypothetical protein [Methylobacterium durans]
MVDRREHLRASKSAALAAKDAFVSRYASGRDDRAVGIGLSRSGNAWAVKVMVHTQAAAQELPRRFRDFEVDVEIVGLAEAL